MVQAAGVYAQVIIVHFDARLPRQIVRFLLRVRQRVGRGIIFFLDLVDIEVPVTVLDRAELLLLLVH